MKVLVQLLAYSIYLYGKNYDYVLTLRATLIELIPPRPFRMTSPDASGRSDARYACDIDLTRSTLQISLSSPRKGRHIKYAPISVEGRMRAQSSSSRPRLVWNAAICCDTCTYDRGRDVYLYEAARACHDACEY